MPRSVAANDEAKTGKPTERKSKKTPSGKRKSCQKNKPTMVTPASKKSGEKSPRRKISIRRKKSPKFTSLKMAGNWADALDGNLWIYGEAEKQTQNVPAVPREIIILGTGNTD